MAVTFYDYPGAPSPRRAKMALIEKGLDHETIVIDLAEKEQLTDEFRAVNPACTVPALRLEDGTLLGDNQGIIAWLDAAQPEPPLLGRTPTERGLVASWTARCEFEGLMAVAEVVRNMAPQMKGRAMTGPQNYEQIPELAMRGAARLQHFWAVLDERLADRSFIATDDFTWADITAVATFDFSKVARQRPGDEFKNLHRWREAVGERESVAATLPKR
ncbi:glutathione S-transferase family protein [Parvularcula maris]|uniref:Glutathione S-transferase n=1 Tax=Parvularcula maris TaxID=2965077 RepID=A0A9X2RK60_9PROT|nr:glutathione S-transferase [Parvularcula maris]MCQ8185282.1 glutathione S-transferase [Parvularcula maris]